MAERPRETRLFEVICEINREINARSELKPLLESIAENTARLLDADAVSVMLYDERTQNVKTFTGWKSWASQESAVVFSAHEGIIGRVVASRQGMRVADASRNPDFKPSADTRLPPIRSLMCVPLMDRSHDPASLVGVINTSRRDFPDRKWKGAFSEEELRIFEKFADQITAAIQRSRVFEETRRRTLQLQIVNEIGGILSSSLAKVDNFQQALDHLADSLHLSYAQLVLVDGERGSFNFNTYHQPDFLPPALKDLDRSARARDAGMRVAANSSDRCLLPLDSGGRRIGCLYTESEEPYFSEEANNRRVLETVRDQFFIAFENFQLFREISQSKQKLEELDRTKNELISIVSHDFRSPLTVIHAYSELLLLQPEMGNDTKQEYLNSIFEQIGHLRRLADGLLKITRIESGEMKYTFDALPFEILAEKFSARKLPKHTLHFEHDPALPPLRADFDKLFEILDNLISNAMKYSPKGGDVIVNARKKRNFIEIQVRDQGLGIAPEQIGNLFQKYHRIHNEKTKHIRGTGLGLYICKKMVEGHGGTIGVRSKPGQGSTFFFTIPIWHPE
jgi:K+-sensing histidine kinase KdpD